VIFVISRTRKGRHRKPRKLLDLEGLKKASSGSFAMVMLPLMTVTDIEDAEPSRLMESATTDEHLITLKRARLPRFDYGTALVNIDKAQVRFNTELGQRIAEIEARREAELLAEAEAERIAAEEAERARIAAEKAAAEKAAAEKAAAEKAAAEKAAAEKAAAEKAAAEKAAAEKAAAEGKSWKRPITEGYRLSSEYGMRTNPVTGVYKLHGGIDLAADAGTPVRSISGGEIISAGSEGGWGNIIRIRHWDGTVTWYAHLSSFDRTSGSVDPGEIIGRVGSTGNSTGPHLHFEVHPDGGDPVDPVPWLADRGVNF
jgi:murein DD-endopeptidase MepM/ murein hydrolase activator NlpD